MATQETPVLPEPKKVETIPPPIAIMPTLNRQIDAAISALPKDKSGVIMLDVETTTGVNLVFVKKFKRDWDVLTFVGKKWGAPVHAGVTVRKSFD